MRGDAPPMTAVGCALSTPILLTLFQSGWMRPIAGPR